jgi:signal transduction histidine kinase
LLARREEEISWLKREFHDSLGPLLFTIGMNVKWASSHCPPEATAVLARLQETATILEDAVQTTRRLSSMLRTDALNWGSLGIEEALSEYAATLEAHSQISIQFSSQLRNEEAVAPETAAHMYAIICEALKNAVHHAQATAITVTLDHIEQELRISVQDNGVGFDLTAQLSAPTGGLEEMFARTRLIRGELNIHATPKQGTVVQLRAPLAPRGETNL